MTLANRGVLTNIKKKKKYLITITNNILFYLLRVYLVKVVSNSLKPNFHSNVEKKKGGGGIFLLFDVLLTAANRDYPSGIKRQKNIMQ